MLDARILDRFTEDVSSITLFLLRGILVFLFEGPLLRLLFLGIVLRIVGQYAASRSLWPQRLGLFAFLAVCLLGFLTLETGPAQIGPYVVLGFRAFLVLLVVHGAAEIALPIVGWAWSLIRRPFRWARAAITRLRRGFARFIESRRPPAPIPPLPPPPTVQELVGQAETEYEAKCQVLSSATMDTDERDAALLFAKQKYLRRLHEITSQ